MALPGRQVVVLLGPFLVAGSLALGEPGVPSPAVRRLLDVDWHEPGERSTIYREHGLWDDEDLVTDDQRLEAALVIGDLRDDSLLTDEVSPRLAGQWLAARGELIGALERLEASDDPRSHLLRGDVLLALGRGEEARVAWEATVPGDTPASRTDAVTALRRLAELDLARGDAYRRLMQTYGAVRESSPLDWTASLQESDLLMEKYNPALADQAIREVLALNPRLGEAWLMLGRLHLMRFDFDGTETVVAAIRDLVPDHPMADILEGESLLKQKDPGAALLRARRVRLALPTWKEAMILELSAMAMLEDPDLEPMMARYEAHYPGSPMAAHRTGSVLAFQRQYTASDRWLRRAIEIRPGWPAPRIELGLVQWQDARMDDAIQTLRRAWELDNFNRRAKNSLDLLEEVASYETVETPHFLLRYEPGVDELLVREMLPRLESIYEDTVEAFGWEPDRRTEIELYPDHERFAVRIIGMPDIHTVAACTGPCVAMESPRLGVPSKHMGQYDWERVLRHEFAHTINLGQTGYRVPLWLTEAAAVWMEPGPRNWQATRMLADELQAGTLLDMEELTWAFVRPRRPQDRSLAYAQSNWMLEFLIERWGDDAMQVLMEGIRDGQGFPAALREATGLDEAAFFEAFLSWGRLQVASWGLAAEPSLSSLLAGEESQAASMERRHAEHEHFLRGLRTGIGQPGSSGDKGPPLIDTAVPASIDDDGVLEELLASHPDHPDVLESALERVREGADITGHESIDLARSYIEVRPGDPLGHEVLAQWYLERDEPGRAVDALAVLVDQEEYDPMVARRLSRAMRLAGRYLDGAAAMERSVGISPYNPELREEAAAAAIEAESMDAALRHMEALVALEPDEPLHQRRLRALEVMLTK